MKQLSSADVRIITTDAIADGVLEYTRALARVRTADLIVIPGLTEDGRLVEARFVLGWGSQVAALPVVSGASIAGGDVAEDLQRRARALLQFEVTVGPDADSAFYDPDDF